MAGSAKAGVMGTTRTRQKGRIDGLPMDFGGPFFKVAQIEQDEALGQIQILDFKVTIVPLSSTKTASK